MEDKLTVYVDGSFDESVGRYSYGVVLIYNDEVIEELSGNGNDPEVAKIRNVAGEMLGAMHAVKWAGQNGYNNIEIYYDYIGIEMWATLKWKRNNQYTKGYSEYMQNALKRMNISFHKVAAHTGIKYNERADELAKRALEK